MQKPFLSILLALSFVLAGSPSAQTVASDPSERLREVLPADVASRVLQTIAEAHSNSLPSQALANRALKFAARGVPPGDIERSVSEHAVRLQQAREAIQRGRSSAPADDEIEAGAEALRLGVTGAQISDLARSAPSGRSLAIPLFVLASLADRGLPSDQALQRVVERLQARASDAELEQLPTRAPTRGARAPSGQAKGASKRPESPGAKGRRGSSSGGRPATVPSNPGKGNPANPPGKP